MRIVAVVRYCLRKNNITDFKSIQDILITALFSVSYSVGFDLSMDLFRFPPQKVFFN